MLWKVCPYQSRRYRRRHSVSTACDLLGLGIWFASIVFVDDVVGGKALGIKQLSWLQHAHFNIGDYVFLTVDRHQRKAVTGCHCVQRFIY